MKDLTFSGGSPPILHPTENIYYTFVHKPSPIVNNYNIWCICFYKVDKWIVKGYTENQINTTTNHAVNYVSGALYDKINNQWILSGGYNSRSLGFWYVKHDMLLSKMTYL